MRTEQAASCRHVDADVLRRLRVATAAEHAVALVAVRRAPREPGTART